MLSEQREYFRVDTKLLMSWDAAAESYDSPASPVDEISVELNKLLRAATGEHPTVVKLVSLLNHKLDAIKDELAPSDNARKLRWVNISGDGLSFTSSRSVEKQASLDISMIVPSTKAHIDVKASVVRCERIPTEDGSDFFRIHCQFRDGQDEATEQIIALVADVQREMLAKRRMLLDPEDQAGAEQLAANG